MARVAVTGIAGFTPIGNDWETVQSNIESGVSGVKHISEWEGYEGLGCYLGSPVTDFELPSHFGRKQTRTMGRVARMGVYATERALIDAGLFGEPEIKNGSMGSAYGSCTGSSETVEEFGHMLLNSSTSRLNATSYIRLMSHTALANIGVHFNLTGRAITTSSACTSGSQGIGYAYEAIKWGKQTYMVAGGAEELCPTIAAVFDTLFAASTRNDNPTSTPAPFDKNRDGLVVGEGACSFVLENYDHAVARGAKIYAEIVGFATNMDGTHMTQPRAETQTICMREALKEADIPASEIGYICAHGTATDRGDVAESTGTASVFGAQTPISSMKGHIGHTLGACGAIESWWAINMMNNDWYAPTLNLETVDDECGDLDYIYGTARNKQNEYVMNNNFAFGGINTSLIFKRV